MKILAPDVEQAVAASEDIFGRDLFGDGLLKVFDLSDDPLVVALDEPWGSGKTVFARRLASRARDQKFKVVYFDAFKHDYDPDVFVSLASQIIEETGIRPKEKKELKAKAKDVAKIVGLVAIKGAIRGLTAGVVRASDFEDANEDVANEVGKEIEAELDKIIDSRLESAKTEQRAFEVFRQTLSTLMSTGDSDKPLIFIVDELDRCRPTYALSVLETIKHLFSVKNVHFLLVCQLDQLSAATRKMYGSEIDASLYLEKFVHFRVTFPQFEKREKDRLLKRFVLDVLKAMPDDDESGRLKDGFAEFISLVWERGEYSLRRIERLCTLFGLCLAFTNKKTIRHPALIHILCDLKLSSPMLFAKAKTGTLNYLDVKNFYRFSDDLDKRNNKLDWYSLNWRYFLSSTEELKGMDVSGFRDSSFYYNIEREDVVRFLANNIVERFAFPT
ncbi:KAP family P-loop NTPase fold protein [Mesorhizobium opportunistum]|uniref:KAP P-loop domain protein n=1 Tax=Mesorhizobium opportunistum (strain LMG 24607 / HAMBI 3007 / WSM2075) TaxID=536019 RepID=F7YFZ0_MESOW|nr:P-loop NTPase fold protein [Mesorhizobium opportunistum]AEH88021.1 KAP P-loop domain protein [Mesorhizobium opportunistum WSM2075]